MNVVKLQDKDIIKAASESESIAACLRKLDLVPSEGRYRMIRSHFIRLNIDTSHFLTSSQLLKKYPIKSSSQLSNELIFTENSHYYCNKTLKNKLLKMGVENKCSECGLDSWQDKPISLELDHINGDFSDNRIENLRILCPNCHSQTPTFRRKRKESLPNNKCLGCGCLLKQRISRCRECASKESISLNGEINLKQKYYCQDCNSELGDDNSRCLNCHLVHKARNIPLKEDLKKLLWEIPSAQIAKQFGVSDKSICKWTTKYGLSKPPRGYWAKKQFGKLQTSVVTKQT